MTIKAFIFDVDGTLAETERDGHRIAFNRAFAEGGLDWHWDPERYGELLAVTGGKERILHHWRTIDPIGAERPRAKELIRRIHQRKNTIYSQFVSSGSVALRAGVRRVLFEARDRGYVLGIATTTTPENVEVLLRSTLGEAGSNLFQCIGAGGVVVDKKPAPDIYQWVLRQLNMQPGDCVAFEDSRPGLRSARQAGIETVVTHNAYSRDDAFPDALAVLDGLGEPGSPATGVAAGGPWSGVVGIDQILGWVEARTTEPGHLGARRTR
jgi:beta-phosphoglucomutase-like phosphatase (HAD superfamily)